MRLSIIIPAFEAEAYLAANLRMLEDHLCAAMDSFEIVVVDDGSRDRTSEAAAGFCHVRLIRLDSNRGKFGAIKAGMRHARGSCCLFTDADLPYGLNVVTRMERLVNERGFHVVIGDRSLGASEYETGVPPFRRAFSWLSRHFIRIFVIAGIPDSQCGIKALRGDVAKELFSLIQEERFAADVELLYIALKYNLEIKRIPVKVERVAPSSVRVWRDTSQMLARLARLRSSWRRGVYRSEVLEQVAASSCLEGEPEPLARSPMIR